MKDSERKLIADIQAVMADAKPDKASGRTLAETYARLCDDAGKRLERCRGLLEKGMRSEALQIAESEPPLLDLSAQLDFIGVEKWRELCLKNDWPVPKPFDAVAIRLLNEAYSLAQTSEPLVKEYRKAVRERNTVKCIEVLKQLKQMEPSNTNWLEDLKNFEHKRMEEIGTEFTQASRQNDLPAIRQLMEQLNGEWTIPPDRSLRDNVLRRRNELEEISALAQGQQIVSELSAAYSKLDLARTGEAVQQYELLRQAGFFNPSSDMQSQFDEARSWFQEESARREREAQFQDLLDQFRVALDREAGGRAIEKIWNDLLRFEREIPEILQQRAQTVLDNYRLQVQRKRRSVIAFTVGLVALIVVIAGALFAWMAYRHTKDQWRVRIQQAYETKNLVLFNEIVSEMRKSHPIISRSPDMITWANKGKELEAGRQQRKLAFNQALDQLDAIRKNGFLEKPETVDLLVKLSQTNASSSAENERIAQFMRSWNDHRFQEQAKVDGQLQNIMYQIASLLSQINKASLLDVQQVQQTLKQVDGLFAKGSVINATSFELKQQFDAKRAEADKNRQFWTSCMALIDQMDKAETLDEYYSSLGLLIKAFPDDPSIKNIAQVAEKRQDYKDLIELPEINVEHLQFSERFSILSVSVRKDNYFFGNTLVDLSGMERLWKPVSADISKLGQDKNLFLFDLRVAQYAINGVITKLYLNSEPDVNEVAESNKDKQFSMSNIYWPKLTDKKPVFSSALNTTQYKPFALMPHCAFVRSLIHEADTLKSDPLNADIMLVQKLLQLYENKEIMPLLKIRLIAKMLDWVSLLSGNSFPPNLMEVKKSLDKFAPDVEWLCTENPNTKEANKFAGETLADFSVPLSDLRRHLADLMLLKASLGRHVQWVGYASWNAKPETDLKKGVHPSEIWVVRSDAASPLPICYVGAVFTNETYTPLIPLIPGEPLFAPTDKRTTREWLANISKLSGIPATKIKTYPPSWPVNQRQ